MVRNIAANSGSKTTGFGDQGMAENFGYKTVGYGDRRMSVFLGLISGPSNLFNGNRPTCAQWRNRQISVMSALGHSRKQKAFSD